MTDTVKTALVGGIFALLGAIGGAAVTGWSQVELARQKFNSDLVLRALESDSPEQRLQTLRLLVETNLLKDTDIKQGVRDYATANERDPSAIPRVAPSQSFEPPVISNARIYLLTGNREKESLFAPYREELEAAGFRVLGEKNIQDEGRPAKEEVRYFYPQDQRQAERIAEVVKFKLSIPDLPVNLYSDPSVKPGYIEIWFGK
ncbi:MAG: hypothetical protein GY941_04825 [Planctomycetes bacterium]|nr:hypothetical protein [Planctomycetota bacterium]